MEGHPPSRVRYVLNVQHLRVVPESVRVQCHIVQL